jgi:hypothetical protein
LVDGEFTRGLQTAAVGVDVGDGEASTLEFDPPAGCAGSESECEERGEDDVSEEAPSDKDEERAEAGTASSWRSGFTHE